MQIDQTTPSDGNGTFRDREHAGRLLARELAEYQAESPLVIGIPRGGVPVAAVVARELGAELDVMVVRKLGVPGHEELAMGTMADVVAPILNRIVLESFGITKVALDRVMARERAELERRELELRGGRPAKPVAGRTVILVDDGAVTGATLRAAVAALRARGARRIVVAVPVAAREGLADLAQEADRLVCPLRSDHIFMLGQFYEDFPPVSSAFARRVFERSASGPAELATLDVPIPAGEARIAGTLSVPRGARGVIAFAHGSGSGRFSPRNRLVARALEDAGFATLLVDLLTAEEEAVDSQTSELRFDIPLLSRRALAVIDWLQREPHTCGLPLGLFGASTGAAAALIAAAQRPEQVLAVVCRGGRPDLAEEVLRSVKAPTLLIVGADDHAVLELNRLAAEKLRCPWRVEVIAGATHLFGEPGKLEQVAELAIEFFQEKLVTRDVQPA